MSTRTTVTPFRQYLKTLKYDFGAKVEIHGIREHLVGTGIRLVVRGRNPNRKQFSPNCSSQSRRYGVGSFIPLHQSTRVDLYLVRN